MWPVDEARSRVLATVVPMSREVVPLDDALGRVLADEVVAAVDVPPWSNSAMDGYAVRARDVASCPTTLRLNEVVHAGQTPTVRVAPGTATAVMTGAPMPEGADAVVIVENTNGAMSGAVEVREGASVGRFVRPQGGDVARGHTVIARGTVLGPAHLGLAASVGRSTLSVARQPRVAIVTTGDEVVRGDGPLGPGRIYGANHLTLAALVRQAGAEPVDVGHVGDHPDQIAVALREALEHDVVLTTGGVSVGEHDHMKDVLATVGVEPVFWKVRMKPGKPLAFGVATVDGRRVPVFGLPGNPVSCMVNTLQFVRPWLRASMGDRQPHLPVVNATCTDDLTSRPGRARLERVVLSVGEGGWMCASTGSQSSGVLTSMAVAHGLALIGPDERGPTPGDAVRVQLLDTRFLGAADVAFGW